MALHSCWSPPPTLSGRPCRLVPPTRPVDPAADSPNLPPAYPYTSPTRATHTPPRLPLPPAVPAAIYPSVVRRGLSRREFLKVSSAGALALALPWTLEGCTGDEKEVRFFTPHELSTVEAATARILPTDQDPGAREAQ